MSSDISRRDFLITASSTLGAAATASLAGPAIARTGRKRKFNILLVLCDQERAWKSLPAGLKLPGREEIASHGVHFKNYQVNGIACGPSRSVIYTGQHIMRTRMYDNGGPFVALDPKLAPTLGMLMKEQGYYTAYKGKWHLSYPTRAEITDYTQALQSFGFEEWQRPPDTFGRPGEGAKVDAQFTDDAIHWLQQRGPAIAKERPWFLAVNLINPHDIMYFDATGHQNESRFNKEEGNMLTAPERAPYNQDLGFDMPASFPDTLGTKPTAHAAYNEFCNLTFGDLPLSDVPAWRRYQNYYFNCLRDVDTQLARLFKALQESGQARNTIVILSADHGEMGGAHGMRAKGPMVYRENIDVPLVVLHPDIQGGTASEAVLGAVDLAPTLLSFAGMSAGAMADRYPFLKGHDFSSLLSSPQSKGPRDGSGNLMVFTAALGTNPLAVWRRAKKKRNEIKIPEDRLDMDTRSFLRSFYDGRYRFGRYFAPNNHHTPKDWDMLLENNDLELYDDQADPSNLNNLAYEPGRQKELILSLNSKLNALIEREVGVDDGSHMPGDPRNWRRS